MERSSAKHGPARDEQLKHQAEDMGRGVPGLEEYGSAQDIVLRSELARLLSRGDFPAERDTLLARLADADAPAELVARLARVTSDRPFASVHDVMVALGINEPEHRAR